MLKSFLCFCRSFQLVKLAYVLVLLNARIALHVVSQRVHIFVHSLILQRDEGIVDWPGHAKYSELGVVVDHSISVVQMSIASPDLWFNLLFLKVQNGLGLVISNHCLKFFLVGIRIVLHMRFKASHLFNGLMPVALVDRMLSL